MRLQEMLRAPQGKFLELCGISGAGKTQLVMDACCRRALSGSQVVLVDTEGGFDARRFHEMASSSSDNPRVVARVLHQLVVYRTFDALELQAVICDLLDTLRTSTGPPPFVAVFIDSIAFPFRGDFRRFKDCLRQRSGGVKRKSLDRVEDRGSWERTGTEADLAWRGRTSALADIGVWLREISRHNVEVVVSNHLKESEQELVPALGDLWTALVGRRVLLELRDGYHTASCVPVATDHVPEERIGFSITKAGVQGDDEGSGDDVSDVDAETQAEVGSSDEGSDEAEEDEAPSVDCDGGGKHCWPPHWWDSRPAPVSRTADAMFRPHMACAEGAVPDLVSCLLCNGPAPWGVTEVCGEAGTGKTQVCLQFVVASVASSTHTSACYLHSEPAPLRRLQQLMSARGQSGDCLQRIFMESVSTPTELFESLSWKVPLLLRHASLKLLVIDSIAALFRDGALSQRRLSERSVLFFRLASMLQRISSEFGIPVVVTNQVSADMAGGVKPALGHSWSSCLTHRLSLHRNDRSWMKHMGKPLYHVKVSARSARVEFSSSMTAGTVPFEIHVGGLHVE